MSAAAIMLEVADVAGTEDLFTWDLGGPLEVGRQFTGSGSACPGRVALQLPRLWAYICPLKTG
jgi:hypothetical protein